MRVLQTFLSAGWLRPVQLAGPSAHRCAAALQYDWQRVRVMHVCLCVYVRGVCWGWVGWSAQAASRPSGCLLPCFAGASGVPSQPGCTEIDCTGSVAPMQEFFAGWLCVQCGDLSLVFRPNTFWIRGTARSPAPVCAYCMGACYATCLYLYQHDRKTVRRA